MSNSSKAGALILNAALVAALKDALPHINSESDDCCPDGECEMHVCDDSYDDHFGTVRIAPYLQCNVCNRTEALS